jgi:hypothetical protein
MMSVFATILDDDTTGEGHIWMEPGIRVRLIHGTDVVEHKGARSSPGAEPVLLEFGEHFGERHETTTEAIELVAALEAVSAPAPLPGPAAWDISESDCMANV